MGTDRKINPPCEACGVEVNELSDHSGGWQECPSCGHRQNIRPTPGGLAGKLTRYELADFDPATGHLHTCRRREYETRRADGIVVGPSTTDPCDCAVLLFELAQDIEHPPELRDLMTDDEHQAVRMCGELSVLVRRICGPGRIGDHDFNELVAPIHVIQRTIGSQAAARAFAFRYRLLGEDIDGNRPT